MIETEGLEPVGSIKLRQAKQFLKKLANKPFITIIFEGDKVTIYAKSISEESLGDLRTLLASLE